MQMVTTCIRCHLETVFYYSYVYDGVQVDSKKIWKFNRYFIMQEYQTRSAVPMPFSIIPNIYEIVKTLIFSSTCCPHSLFNGKENNCL